MNYMRLKNIAWIIATIMVLVACEKDNTEPKTNNSIKMDGQSFTVASASMIGVSIGDDGHTGITLVSGSGTQANTLTIDVESFTKETIEGEYAYPVESGKKQIDDWLTNYSVFNGSSMTSSNLESGEVSVTNNGGNNYTIDMNMTMDDGVTFIGTYTGEFQVMFNNQ